MYISTCADQPMHTCCMVRYEVSIGFKLPRESTTLVLIILVRCTTLSKSLSRPLGWVIKSAELITRSQPLWVNPSLGCEWSGGCPPSPPSQPKVFYPLDYWVAVIEVILKGSKTRRNHKRESIIVPWSALKNSQVRLNKCRAIWGFIILSVCLSLSLFIYLFFSSSEWYWDIARFS